MPIPPGSLENSADFVPYCDSVFRNVISDTHTESGGYYSEREMIFKSVLGFALLTAFFLVGDLLHRVGVPIPGGVLGLLLLYLALQSKLIKMQWIDRTAGFLLKHMVLLFVPLTVGLMEMWPILSQHIVAIAASLVVSWAAVIVTTGLLGQWLLPAQEQASEAEGDKAK